MTTTHCWCDLEFADHSWQAYRASHSPLPVSIEPTGMFPRRARLPESAQADPERLQDLKVCQERCWPDPTKQRVGTDSWGNGSYPDFI